MKIDKTEIPDSVHNHVLEQLIGKDWGELKVLEHADYLLFPEKIYRRKKDGKFEEIKICLRVPRDHEMRKARVQARAIAIDEGLDPKLDRDLISNIEDFCILSMAIRNATPPHEPWEPDPQVLSSKYDKQCLMQIWAKLDGYTQVLNPAPQSMSEEEMLALILAITKERNILPLHVYGSEAQTIFIISMADQLASSLVSRSSSEPLER